MHFSFGLRISTWLKEAILSTGAVVSTSAVVGVQPHPNRDIQIASLEMHKDDPYPRDHVYHEYRMWRLEWKTRLANKDVAFMFSNTSQSCDKYCVVIYNDYMQEYGNLLKDDVVIIEREAPKFTFHNVGRFVDATPFPYFQDTLAVDKVFTQVFLWFEENKKCVKTGDIILIKHDVDISKSNCRDMIVSDDQTLKYRLLM